MKHITSLILLFLTVVGYSQPRTTYTTTSGGSWVNVLNWDVGVPDNDQTTNTDDIIITHHITLTDNLDLKSGTTLLIEGCDTLHVTGDVTFNNGSSITVENCAVLIIDGNVTNSNNSDDVVINGTIIIAGNYDGGNGSDLSGTGSMEIEGSVTTDGDGAVFGSESDCDSETEDCDNSGLNPLPVDLIWFNGVYNQESEIIEISWLVGSEINNDYYEIIRVFKDSTESVVGYRKGFGNSNSSINYTFNVTDFDIGVNYYYLKQVDFDGKYKIYKTISVIVDYVHNKNIVIWPNPNSSHYDDLNVSLRGFKGSEVLLVLLDVHGKIHFERVVVSLTDDTIIIIESELPTGTYMVVGSEKNELYRRKLVITE